MAQFIVIEGIDGSGKSTVVESLKASLADRDILFTEEPTKSWLGDAVRRSHIEGVNPLTEAFLFMADRVAHTEEIKEWLSEDKMVICDRYYHSTVAYQGAALHGSMSTDSFEWLLDINRRIALEPDVVFLLDVDPSTAIARVSSRGGKSKFEQEDFLRKVADNYSRLARDSDNILVIDASRTIDDIVSDILGKL